MTTPATVPEAAPKDWPLSVRVTPDQRAALEYLVRLFPDKYRGQGSVLEDYSLTEAVAVHRRAVAMRAEQEEADQ